jgi:hypothetical protein
MLYGRQEGRTMNLAPLKQGVAHASGSGEPGAPAEHSPVVAHQHLHPHALSRRRLFQLAAGTAAASTVLAPRLLQPVVATARQGDGTPKPIPGGSAKIAGAFGTPYHVYGPGAIDPSDAEPATITDFNGTVGLAYPSGMVTRINTQTGEVARKPFNDADMRFMSGVYRGTDGNTHQGTFVFI